MVNLTFVASLVSGLCAILHIRSVSLAFINFESSLPHVLSWTSEVVNLFVASLVILVCVLSWTSEMVSLFVASLVSLPYVPSWTSEMVSLFVASLVSASWTSEVVSLFVASLVSLACVLPWTSWGQSPTPRGCKQTSYL